MSTKIESNYIVERTKNYQYPAYSEEKGVKKVVAFGDHSHKCPVYTLRIPPCTAGCPSGEDIRSYLNLLRGIEKSKNKWEAAWRKIVDKNPFPAVMGRVCPHPCESKCNRQFHDENISINAVEHAIGEYGLQNNLSFEKPTIKTSKHIAVIGGGPAGLSAAYQLARKGHKVTIYEAQDKLGGMIRYGIMRYRVNREVLEKEINRILDLGIEVKTNFRIGKDISLDELKKKHDAVFIGVGAQKGRNIPIPGFDGANQTINSIDFLMEFEKKGESMQIGKQVLVIGDGNVAMDVARLALRLGSQAAVVSGVPKNEMACFPEEFDDAVNEGTNFHLQIGSIEVIRNGNKVKSLKCTKMQKKEKGEEGWNSSIPFLRYKPIIGTEFVIECDMIVSAIGQSTDMAGLESIANNANWLQVDSNYKVKGMDGVFGGGDAIKIDLITTAIGHGNKAAKAIDDYINSKTPPPSEYQDIIPYEKLHPNSFLPSSKVKRKHLKIDSIIGNYSETIKSLDQDSVIKEAGRCMSCGLCFECNQCLLFCPQGAISKFKFNPIGEVMFTDYNMCIGCHLCADICPTGYIRMGMGEDL